MNKVISTLILISIPILSTGQNLIDSLESKAINNQKPEKWNLELLEMYKENAEGEKTEPLHDFAFPVEEYDYYVFTKPFHFQIGDSHFSGIAFGENREISKGKYEFKHEMAIIFHTGEQDIQINGQASSRNYPYLLGQGQIGLENVFDFIGIKSVKEDSGYILVNLKTFDLRFGQTVIIFPNKDNSFYYLQSREEPETDKKFDEFIDRLKKDDRIPEMIELRTK
ncbi:hypothetical protein JL193_05775 [Polaribacter batillariae]|uniref:Uncharacterized protein n=1 Tax=Polaribacter batillariae TaxID=2808900 RepID=A0ABX7SZR0_9FLAO|nr:hypothetical protein [Polaribacter batillariae]QTD38775.1 hypothetical protein JL193_05775 [Polaribacter batillariae]